MRRIPWSFLLGLGAGAWLLVVVRGSRSRRRHARLPREPEVIRSSGPTPVEAGVETPVASAAPDTIPERSSRAIPPPRRSSPPQPGSFEPVVPDAPEVRDPAAEPREDEGSTGPAAAVPPRVRRKH